MYIAIYFPPFSITFDWSMVQASEWYNILLSVKARVKLGKIWPAEVSDIICATFA